MRFNYDVLSGTEKIIYALRALYQEHGYARYRMGKFEEYDLYSRNKEFLDSDRVLTFTDTNGRLMALKPDVTLSIIKNGRDVPGAVQKVCYNENVYRAPRGNGSFREIMQAGLECIGEIDEGCVGEVLSLAAESLAMFNTGFVLELSHLDILSAFVDAVAEGGPVRREILKCVGEKNLHGVTEICRAQEIDESRAEPLKALMALYGTPGTVLPALKELAPESAAENVAALEAAVRVFEGTPLAENIRVDFSLVGDMHYYNGVIFKGFLDGIPGSVLSGGQYDRLMRKMGRRSRAIGFAVYLDMLERLNGITEANGS